MPRVWIWLPILFFIHVCLKVISIGYTGYIVHIPLCTIVEMFLDYITLSYTAVQSHTYIKGYLYIYNCNKIGCMKPRTN